MTADEFIANAEFLIGKPYSEIDCIGLVRASAHIRCQGTNWLWRSYNSRGKYQYLTARMERPPLTKSEMRKGLLLFRVKWGVVPKGYTDKPDCHHVGILTGTHVIQSNSGTGVYKELYDQHKWDACGWLKQITESDETLPFEQLIPSDVYNDPDSDTDSASPSIYEPSDHEMLKALYDHFIID